MMTMDIPSGENHNLIGKACVPGPFPSYASLLMGIYKYRL